MKTFSKFVWQPTRKIGSTLGSTLKKVALLREGGLTTGICNVLLIFGRFVASLVRTQGWRGVVVYLKGCHVLLQQRIGGKPIRNTRRLGVAISQARDGLPRVIPILHRQRIRMGEVGITRVWASVFWLYRVIDIPGKLKISSITKPFRVNPSLILEWSAFLILFLPVFAGVVGWNRNLKFGRSLSVVESESLIASYDPAKEAEFIELLGAKSMPIAGDSELLEFVRNEMKKPKSDRAKCPDGTVPSASLLAKLRKSGSSEPILKWPQPRALLLLTSGPNSAKGPDEGPGPGSRTSIGSILTDILIWTRSELGQRLRPWLYNLGVYPKSFVQQIIAQAEQAFAQVDAIDPSGWDGLFTLLRKDGVERPYSKPEFGFSVPRGLGKLAFLPEPAAKIRIIAMFDSLSQMLLRPLHDVVFEILRSIPQDGTHDQNAPALLLTKKGLMHYWSYDLSAATDRFPVSLQQVLIGLLFGPSVSRAWRETMTSRSFQVPSKIGKSRVPIGTPKTVTYGSGQPMGAYSSWAVFALSHHFLVQWAAYRARGTLTWFDLYALLGDDVVLSDKDVAREYLLLLQAIGVEVGLAKSLISRNGTFEFAKRTWRAGVDLSGWSLDAIGAGITDSHVLEDLLARTSVRGLNEALKTGARVLGYSGGSVSKLLGREFNRERLARFALFLSRPDSVFGYSTFTEWISQVRPGERVTYSDVGWRSLQDGVWQSLLSNAQRCALARGRALSELTANDPNQVRIPDRWITQYPLLNEFLCEWVIKPLQSILNREYDELVKDIEVWSNTTEGIFSLDETYSSLDRIIRELEKGSPCLDPFIRTEALEQVRRVRERSRVVKFWFAMKKNFGGYRE